MVFGASLSEITFSGVCGGALGAICARYGKGDFTLAPLVIIFLITDKGPCLVIWALAYIIAGKELENHGP